MKTTHKFGIIVLAAIFLFAALPLFMEAANLKVRVIVNSANLRLKPSLEGQIIGNVKRGQVLEALQKRGEWYQVTLPDGVTGYVHRSVVEEVKGEAATSVAPPQQGEKAEVKPAKPEEKKVTSRAETPKKQPEWAAKVTPARKKFFIRIDGGYGTKTNSYDKNWTFDMYYEEGAVAENYKIDSSGFALDAGIGFFFMRNLGVEISVNPGSGKSRGEFTGGFPHPFYFGIQREKEWKNDNLKYSDMELNLDLIASFPLSSRFNIYLGAGGTYFSGVKIESLKVINWNESGYPYFDLTITPEYASYAANCFGFNAAGGIDFFITYSIALNLNARYSSGTAKFKVEGSEVTIQPGGVRATAGVKFAF